MIERYANRQGSGAGSRGPAYDPDVPVPGCYRITLRPGAPDSAIRIWLGPPVNPDTGEEVPERGFRWQAAINGQPVDLLNYWPGCARKPISRAEHDRLVERNATLDQDSPFYDPRRPIDLGSAPLPF